MDIRIPPLNINIMLESNPLTFKILVRTFAVVCTSTGVDAGTQSMMYVRTLALSVLHALPKLHFATYSDPLCVFVLHVRSHLLNEKAGTQFALGNSEDASRERFVYPRTRFTDTVSKYL